MKLRLYQFFSMTTMKHIMTIVLASLFAGYKGKTVDFEKYSNCHRTSIAHFLNHGKWDDERLESVLRTAVVSCIYEESKRTGSPVFCMIDDTISSKTKPSSRAKHPIEDAYFHQSHLKKKQDYGHQAVAIMLSCNGLVLNYAVILYDKSKSKIQIVQDVAEQLPKAPHISYLLCDCWYTSQKVMDAFLLKGFYTIGALKTNRIFYPNETRWKINRYAVRINRKLETRLVTVGKRQYYVHIQECRLNGIENAVVILSFPKGAFGNLKALRCFICTDVLLDVETILSTYTRRRPIEVFFRESKNKLALNGYQIRSSKGIRRYWLLMSLSHFICCTGTDMPVSFSEGYHLLQNQIKQEQITYIYQCGMRGDSLEELLALAG